MIELVLENLVPQKPDKPHDIVGKIYFKNERFAFPSVDWIDFASPIIYWWCQRYQEMIRLGLDNCEFLFMDGNYAVEVKNHHTTVDLWFKTNETVTYKMEAVSKSVIDDLLKNAFLKIEAL